MAISCWAEIEFDRREMIGKKRAELSIEELNFKPLLTTDASDAGQPAVEEALH